MNAYDDDALHCANGSQTHLAPVAQGLVAQQQADQEFEQAQGLWV
jgi:hypothetical protein